MLNINIWFTISGFNSLKLLTEGLEKDNHLNMDLRFIISYCPGLNYKQLIMLKQFINKKNKYTNWINLKSSEKMSGSL